jgi:hypothetical protein
MKAKRRRETDFSRKVMTMGGISRSGAGSTIRVTAVSINACIKG